MMVNPADDEINIFLPIAFLIFVGVGLIIFGVIATLIYTTLKKLKVAKETVSGKIAERKPFSK